MELQLPYPYKAIRLDAPTRTYHLMFKYLRGAIKPGTEGADPTYLYDDQVLTLGQVMELLLYPRTILAPTKGHKIAAAAYVWDDTTSTDGSYWVGIVALPHHGVPAELVRRQATTKAIGYLPAVDRAYFHLCLSMMEGRDVGPILEGALVKRAHPDRQLFVEHTGKQLVEGYLRKQLGQVDDLTVQSVLKSLGMGE